MVSIIVPNFNHARYLEKRIDSILNQTYQDFEIILLDDASRDDSAEILKKYSSHPKVSHIVINDKNSGSPFAQWKKGINFAKGEFIWFAESDDWCELEFLETLIKPLIQNRKVALSYCQSNVVSNEGELIERYNYGRFESNRWKERFIVEGNLEIKKYLVFQNTIPNASAVLIRKETLVVPEEIETYRMGGDWLIWLLTLKNNMLAYTPRALNYFRDSLGNTRKHTTLEKKNARIIEGLRVFNHGINPKNLITTIKVLHYNLVRWNHFNRGLTSLPNIFDKKIDRIQLKLIVFWISILGIVKHWIKKAIGYGLMSEKRSDNLTLAIISNSEPGKSETFILEHISKITPDATLIYSDQFGFPWRTEGETYYKLELLLIRTLKKFFKSPHIYQKFRLKKVLKQKRINLVFAEYLFNGALVAGLCKEMKMPLCAIAHGYDVSRNDMFYRYGQYYPDFFEYVSRIVVVSKHMRPILKKWGCDLNKTVHSPVGAREDFFTITPTRNNKSVLMVGRLTEKKAPLISIQSFRIVLQKVPDAVLNILGAGRLKAECEDLVREFGIEKNVHFLGAVDTDTVIDYFSKSSVFIQHSVTASNGDMEGTPTVIMEASAASIPVVSTLHAGIPDVIINGETGFLVKEGDINSMANRIIYLLSDTQVANDMGLKGRKFLQNKFGSKQHIKLLQSIFQEVLQASDSV